MWFDDMLEIQMLQSRLTVYGDAMQYRRIFKDLFEQGDSVCVDLRQETLGLPNAYACGAKEVADYYARQDELVRRNLNFLGANLSCSQKIVLSGEGSAACGTWYTYREDVLGPARGYERPPYPYQLSVGRYDNVFARTEEGWKIRELRWRPVIKLNTYETTVDTEGGIRANVQDWPAPYEPYARREEKQETDPEDIAYCEAVLGIRNRAGELCESWNTGEISGIPEQFFDQDGIFFRQGMPEPVRGMERLQRVFGGIQAKNDRCAGLPGIVLTTSGVVEPNRMADRAKACWTLLALDIVDAKNGKKGSDNREDLPLELENHTGRWYIDWVRRDGCWKIERMQWVNFARMSNLQGRLV